MNDFQKSNNFYKKILEKYSKRQIKKYINKKCSVCNRTLNPTKYFKKNNKSLCFLCAMNWKEYTLLNIYYNNKELYINDYKRDMAFLLDILETYNYLLKKNYKFFPNSYSNIFGERCKRSHKTIVNLNFEKRYLYKYKNNLRVKTSKMFWAIFTLNKIYNTNNEYYLPTELIIDIIYNTMYWIPTITY